MKNLLKCLFKNGPFAQSLKPALLCGLVICSFSLHAQKTWNGSSSTDWNTSANWTPSGVPTATDDVTIPNVTTDPVIFNATSVSAKSVTVDADAVLTINSGGSLTIDGSSVNGMTINGSLTNNGTLNIGQTTAPSETGILNNGSVTNGGTINIENTGVSFNGFENAAVGASLQNTGQINIGQNGGSIGFQGLRLSNETSFVNNGGTLRIDNTSSSGMNVTRSSIENKNGAQLLIGQSGPIGSSGIFINSCTEGNYSFLNDASSIMIDNTGGTGIFNACNHIENVNGGVITIGGYNGITGTSVTNTSNGTLTNGNCSDIYLYKNITNGSSIDNYGLLQISTDQGHTNTGTFTNYGILSYTQLPLVPNVTNEEIILPPKNADCSPTVTNAFGLGATVDFTIHGVFTNPSGTVSAGTYTQNTNVFNPSIAPDSYELYVKIEDMGSGCTRMAKWAVSFGDYVDPVPTCKNNTIVLNNMSSYTLLQSDVYVSGSDNCGTVNYVGANPAEVNDTQIGTDVEVTVTVNDGNGNTGTCISIITVEGPDCINTTRTWTGNVSTDWADRLNWDPTCVPTIEHDVVIPNVTNYPDIMNGTAAVAKSVNVHSSAILDIIAGGSLTISGSTVNGLTNNGTVNNNGTIHIDNTALNKTAINNGFFGTFNNFAAIHIGASASIGKYGINNSGTVNNESGEINIDNTSSDGIYIAGGTFNNRAIIRIGANASVTDYGLVNFSAFNNLAGEISIDRTTEGGIFSIGPLTNQATIHIGKNNSVGFTGIDNYDSFTNEAGQISINRTSFYGIQNTGGTFTNKATLHIGSTNSVGKSGIYNFATFINEAGQINIDRSSQRGILNETSGTFTNQATLHIGANAAVGTYGIDNQGTTKNDAGTINIDNTSGVGVINSNGSFTNKANIYIGANASVGEYSLVNGVTFNNEAGEIICRNSSVSAFLNNGNFTNFSCAIVRLFDDLDDDEGNFINHGLLSIDAADASDAGDFNNFGLIEDVQGTFPINGSGFINNEIVIASTYEDCEEVDPAFSLGATVDFNILGVYTDETLMTTAGTYDVNTNIFTPNIADGQYTFYVQVEDPDNSCTLDVVWEVEFGDTTRPVPVCVPDFTVELYNDDNSAGIYEFDASEIYVNASDNCGTVNFTGISPNTANCSNVGTPFEITATVNDGNGNIGTCITTVTVLDKTPPYPLCIESTVELDGFGNYTVDLDDILLQVFDNCTPTTIVSITPSSLDCSDKNIKTAVTVIVEDDYGNQDFCTGFITPEDKEMPQPTCLNPTVQLDANGSYSLTETDVFGGGMDNCGTLNFVSADPPTVSCSDVGNAVAVTVLVNDGNGNENTCEATVTVEDKILPQPICLSKTVELDINGNYTILQNDVYGGGSDNCSTINFLSFSPQTVDCSNVGSPVSVVITIEDAHGNLGTCTAQVTVADDEYPCCTPTNIVYVNGNTPNDNDGSDWGNAFASLQRALEQAGRCPIATEIWVATGTYHPTNGSDRSVSFGMVNGVAIYGGFTGSETNLSQRDWEGNHTVLSGDIGTTGDSTDNSYHVVRNGNTIGPTAVLDGFTISGGNANKLLNETTGAGMLNEGASPTVRNCTFSINTALSRGGGMSNKGGSPVVSNCSFLSNSATDGGAMANVSGSAPTVDSCSFIGNMATGNGGAVYSNASAPSISGCSFEGNHSDGSGGAIAEVATSSGSLISCPFAGNSAGSFGGAVYSAGGSSTSATNCTLLANSADFGGGLYAATAASPTVTNCTFHANSATHGDAIANQSAAPVLANCILWGNSTTEIENYTTTTLAMFSIIKQATGVYPGTGNLNEDPLFASSTDLRVNPCSPAADAGNSAANTTALDILGNARIIGTIDMGAFESQIDLSIPCTFNGLGGTTNWTDADNWSDGFVPGSCRDVIIPTGFDVIVPANLEGYGKTLEVETGATLETAPAAVLGIGN